MHYKHLLINVNCYLAIDQLASF